MPKPTIKLYIFIENVIPISLYALKKAIYYDWYNNCSIVKGLALLPVQL